MTHQAQTNDELRERISRLESVVELLALSLLRHYYAKDIHDISALEAAAEGDLYKASEKFKEAHGSDND